MEGVQQQNKEIEVSEEEKDLLREIVRSEMANVKVFNLSSDEDQEEYENLLERLDAKLT